MTIPPGAPTPQEWFGPRAPCPLCNTPCGPGDAIYQYQDIPHHMHCLVARLEQQAAWIAKLERRLDLDRYYVMREDGVKPTYRRDPVTGKLDIGLVPVETTQREREDMLGKTDRVLCLEIGEAHYKAENKNIADQRDAAIKGLNEILKSEVTDAPEIATTTLKIMKEISTRDDPLEFIEDSDDE